jgi:hypothetical protein
MSNADPIPAIPEIGAKGEIKDLYQDIRDVTGVGVVNLVWRCLATHPGALPFAWNLVRPAYASGLVGTEGRAFRRGLRSLGLPLIPKAVLAAAGVDSLGLRSIRTILDSYDRTNAMNLVGLGALLVRLGDSSSLKLLSPQPIVEPALPPLPPLPPLDALDPQLRYLVEILNDLGETDGRVIASMYRHLAFWPGYLALIWVQLSAASEDGRLQAAIQAARISGRAHADRVASALPKPDPDLDPAIERHIRETVTLFTEHPISKMCAICRALAEATPAP